MDPDALDFYRTPAGMTALPNNPMLAELPSDRDDLRRVIQGLILHRDWAPAYGVTNEAIRLEEQHLRSTVQVLERAFELSLKPITATREPVDRVLGICRHFTLLHVAFLRSQGVPARVRCGFGSYFEKDRWSDHWITERWDGQRWVRDDPQIDELQARRIVDLDFDPHDQSPGRFLSGAEAWVAARAGEVDPQRFGIFDMWGISFIGGNVLLDLACLNKVELLPWDVWGLAMTFGPHDEMTDDLATTLDDLAAMVLRDDTAEIRARYLGDHQLQVPTDIVSFIDGEAHAAHLTL
jgi:hypothetical protein